MQGKPSRPPTVAQATFTTLCEWLKRLNRSGYFAHYSTRSAEGGGAWAPALSELHTAVVPQWPMLHGCLARSAISRARDVYVDKFPFLDQKRTLPSAGFLDAMILADEAQVALRSGAEAPTCPRCASWLLRVRLLEARLREATGVLPTQVPDGDAGLLVLMKSIYDDCFLHGCGVTPREQVRRTLNAAVAQELQLDVTKQKDLWHRFVAEELLDPAQRDSKFINCCPRYGTRASSTTL